MRVIHVITSINRGGAENHLKDLIYGQIANQNLQVFCAYLKGNGFWAKSLKEMGCKVFSLNVKKYWTICPANRLRKIVKKIKPDIVHAHLAPAELFSRIALLGDSDTPFVITRHNHNKFYRGFTSNIVERWVVSRAQAMIGISNSVHCFFTKKYPFLQSRFDVVPYGIDSSPFCRIAANERDGLRLQWDVAVNTVLIGTVARLVPIKNLKILIDGFARLVKENPSLDTKLILAGSGPLEAKLKKQAIDLGLHDLVVFAGFQQDIPLVMSALDVFVLTSFSEGFGLVLLEAMSASKPIISTKVSSLPEIIVEEKTGLLTKSNDSVALSEAMKRLVKDKGFRARLGAAGHARVVSHFSLDSMWSKTMEIYKRISKCK